MNKADEKEKLTLQTVPKQWII